MKYAHAIFWPAAILVLAIPSNRTFAQTPAAVALPAPTAWAAVSRDAHATVWERTVYELGPNGAAVPKKHRYTELATGLNYRDQQTGQWLPSQEQIDLLPQGGAAATQGQHQAYFPGDIFAGAITLVTPEGKHLQSRPVGLFYEDDSNSVLIAVLTNSVGELVGSNQVIYPDAFEGATASLRYTYTKAGFEQDVVVQAQLPAPQAFGLDPTRTRLEVLTEFFDTNQPAETTTAVNPRDGLSDTILAFGKMKMTRGRAFAIGDKGQGQRSGAPTYKRWWNVSGRQFLVEEVPYRRIAPQLSQLPPSTGRLSAGDTNLLAAEGILHRVSPQRLLPPARGAQAGAQTTPRMKLATAVGNLRPFNLPALVMDYVVVNSSLANYVFQGDTTYYLSGPVTISGTTTLEGGTILKFAPGVSAKLSVDQLNCRTGPYRPAVLTARDDNTVGEVISGSTGSPSGYYADRALEVDNTSGGTTVTNLRIAYASTAFYDLGDYDSYETDTARDVQLLNCGTGFYLDGDALQNLVVENSLLWEVGRAFAGYGWDYSGSAVVNVTLDGCTQLATDDSGAGGGIFFTNSLLANVTNPPGDMTINGSHNGFYNSDTFGDAQILSDGWPFQTTGAGSHYLANDSVFRNSGLTNLDSSLLAELAQKTTYPPLVYSNTTLPVATTFSPQAQRDTDTPDLGYHYDPLDYCFGGVAVATNLTFTAGTVFGWFELPGSGGPGYGIALPNWVTATFNGTVTAPCVFTRYDTVQEGGNSLWKDKGWLGGMAGIGSLAQASAAPQVMAAFTRFAELAGDPNFVRDYTIQFVLRANDSEFWSGSDGGYGIVFDQTNCLHFRSSMGAAAASSSDSAIRLRNCTFFGGSVNSTHWSGSTWPVWIENCAFDGTTFGMDDNSGGNTNITYCDFNAFLTNAQRTIVEGGHDLTVAGYNWQSSWFGDYYLPPGSPLIDAGSTTADQVGLYHFTTQVSLVWDNDLNEGIQLPETNSIVDIGYHYVAADQYGHPLDSNNDGIPDYLEDANGNGQVDSGEIGWNLSGDPGLSVIITRPRNGSTLP